MAYNHYTTEQFELKDQRVAAIICHKCCEPPTYNDEKLCVKVTRDLVAAIDTSRAPWHAHLHEPWTSNEERKTITLRRFHQLFCEDSNYFKAKMPTADRFVQFMMGVFEKYNQVTKNKIHPEVHKLEELYRILYVKCPYSGYGSSSINPYIVQN